MPNYTHHADHADHNFDAANFLISNDRFFDWSATMAFYSAVHYVESVLDYLASKGTNLNYYIYNIKVAHSNEISNNNNYPVNNGKPLRSPHDVRRLLVQTNFPIISTNYSLLYDASFCQRYMNYRQSDHVKCSKLIERHLEKIREWHKSIIK
jgi:hypothetical protein